MANDAHPGIAGPPYHSTRKAAIPVYHVYADCYGGSVIRDEFRHDGTGNHPLCRECAAMARRVQLPPG